MSKTKSFLPAAARNDHGGTPTARPLEPLITIKAAAARLGVSTVTVRRRVKDGGLPHIRISGRLYFKNSELHAFIEAHRGGLVDANV